MGLIKFIIEGDISDGAYDWNNNNNNNDNNNNNNLITYIAQVFITMIKCA